MAEPGKYEIALQAFQTEPAIVAQVINAGMQRVQSLPAVQDAVRFVEALLGRRATFTLADVAPLAKAVRQRIGVQANLAGAKANKANGLGPVSLYASLLGQALLIRMRSAASVELMRAWAKCIAETRAGPATSLSRELVTLASSEVTALGGDYAAAGDSKDLFILMSGTTADFKEGTPNKLADKSKLACDEKVELVTLEDGKADLDSSMTAMADLDTALEKTIGKENDISGLQALRRTGKELTLLAADKSSVAADLATLMTSFRTHGRLFIKVK